MGIGATDMTDTTQPEALRLANEYRLSMPQPMFQMWAADACVELRRLHARVTELEAHVQKPAETEHVAGDVSKNGRESNMAQALADGFYEAVNEMDGLYPQAPAVPAVEQSAWVNPCDKSQERYLPDIGEAVLFKHEGRVYTGRHTGGSFKADFPLGKHFDTWNCLWTYPSVLDSMPAAPQPEAQAQAAPRVCRRCNGTGKVKLHNWVTGGDRWQDCWDCAKGFPPRLEAPAVPGEIDLIEKAAKRVGITSLLNHGAASCVYSEGCAGVSQEHLLAYTREIALHCAVSLAAQGGV
jgi:hypothetical protein